MRTSLLAAALVGAAIAAGPAAAHDDAEADGSMADNIHLHASGNDGHVPAGINYGFEVVGIDTLEGVSDGKYTDVWAAEIAERHYAFVGTFQEPTCDRSGVFVSDITDPVNPTTITMIKSPPNTRINDVKTHLMGDDRTVLIFTLEPCGPLNGNATRQRGQGGISIWDVSDPAKPHALKQNLLDFPVHNTFPWTTADGNTYLMLVNDIDVQDTHIVDMTKPQSPKLITTTGILDWLADGVLDDGQGFTGSFAAPLLHDIWVERDPLDYRWYAVLSYWDAGFIKLDVTDPFNPVFLGDSTYPAMDPVHGWMPQEGNAHAAVFGGPNSEYIFGGDEDFDVFQTVVTPIGGVQIVASQGSDVPQIDETASVTGPTVFVGRACTSIDAAPVPDAMIALIERGDCAFTTKADNIGAAGYVAGIVFNDTRTNAGCETTVSMLVTGGQPMLFIPRSGGFGALGIAGYDPSQCTGGGDGGNPALPVAGTAGLDTIIASEFDGWGYLHLLANKEVPLPKFGQPGNFVSMAQPLEEIGYYAPAEVADPQFATDSGDLTMHNIEVDLENRNLAFISWYSLGMRAVEVRLAHSHDGGPAGYYSRRIHEVGRFIADEGIATEFGLDLEGSNFWGVHVHKIGGETYVLGSDRNTGLWIFKFTCTGPNADNPALYCVNP